MPYRLIYIGLAALAVAVIAIGILIAPEGEPVILPDPVESVYPRPGDLVLQQIAIEVDMKSSYRAEIWVDGFRVPDTEIDYVEATGVHRWAPSPRSVYMSGWTPGEHTVLIVWNRITGPIDTGQFEWTFRIQ